MLAGSCYDLVERNNNIVLEYRKSEVIRIALPERIEGGAVRHFPWGLWLAKQLTDEKWRHGSAVITG
ncbi:hypothetical protein ACLB1T_18830 [Escherichia coli]